MSQQIRPFTIAVGDEAVAALKAKLAAASFPAAVDFSDDWGYGAPLSDVKRLARYWAEGFDWRAHEARLNALLPQFKTAIDVDGFGSLDVHFVHQPSSRPGSIPLLFCHGCLLPLPRPPPLAKTAAAADCRCRAGQLHRGEQGAAAAHGAQGRRRRRAVVPRGGAVAAQLWLLRRAGRARLRHRAVRAVCAPADAAPRLRQVRSVSRVWRHAPPPPPPCGRLAHTPP